MKMKKTAKNLPIHKGSKLLRSLRQGQTVYTVHALGERSFIEKLIVMSKAKTETTVTDFGDGHSSIFEYEHVDFKSYSSIDFTPYIYKSSLQDLNIIPNNYNNHKLFTSRRKAESYLELCKKCVVVGFNNVQDDPYSDWVFDEDHDSYEY